MVGVCSCVGKLTIGVEEELGTATGSPGVKFVGIKVGIRLGPKKQDVGNCPIFVAAVEVVIHNLHTGTACRKNVSALFVGCD